MTAATVVLENRGEQGGRCWVVPRRLVVSGAHGSTCPLCSHLQGSTGIKQGEVGEIVQDDRDHMPFKIRGISENE